MNRKDWIFIIVCIFTALIIGIFIKKNSLYTSNELVLEVISNGSILETIDMQDNVVYEIKNNDGIVTNTLEIKDKKAQMISANCPNQICVHMHQIQNPNESICCLPNKVIIKVVSLNDSDMDAISY